MGNELILIVDSDERNLNLLNVTLKAHDYRCITTKTGESALVLANSNNPDVIILDVLLSDMDGTEVIKTIRSWSDVPILVISTRNEDHDKVMALDAGADDYIVKPFSVEELLARIRAIKRRFDRGEHNRMEREVFHNGSLTVDYEKGIASINDCELHLTPIEYRILCLLAQNIGCVLSHAVITQKIWGRSYSGNVMTLRTFVATLRKKIASLNGGESYIATQNGVGYKMKKI